MLFSNINISSKEYNSIEPYPYYLQDNFLDNDFAKNLQNEIINIPSDMWDRYDNPFEQKYTLRDKYNFPPLLRKLFNELENEDFVHKLSEISGYKLIKDSTRNFWGVHKYKPGDKLDIHVDAGLDPTTKNKKQLTLGIYLSLNWKEEYGCQLEVWKGDNSISNDAKIYEKIESISPMYNRMIMFTCNDYSWHGNPEPSLAKEDAFRIFITISYLSENYEDLNKRQKAFFVARPNDPYNEEKNKLRLLRADPKRFKEIYRV